MPKSFVKMRKYLEKWILACPTKISGQDVRRKALSAMISLVSNISASRYTQTDDDVISPAAMKKIKKQIGDMPKNYKPSARSYLRPTIKKQKGDIPKEQKTQKDIQNEFGEMLRILIWNFIVRVSCSNPRITLKH